MTTAGAVKKVTAPFPSKKCLSPLKIKERGTFYGIIFLHMKIHQRQYSPKQGRLPVFIADLLDICDPVLTFDQIMEEIGIEQYLKPDSNGQLILTDEIEASHIGCEYGEYDHGESY